MLERSMNFKKIIIPLILFVSISVSDDHKRKQRKIKRNKHYHPVKIHQPRVSMRLNWHWSHWWHDCRIHDRIVVVNQESDDKNKNATVLEIIEQIEKIAELKEKGLITEKDYQKKKKELLKRI
jgi:hypothetical protein